MMNTLGGVIAVVLGSVLLAAGLGKLLQGPDAFVYTLNQFAAKLGFPASEKAFRLLARSLPWCQVIFSTLLLKGVLIHEAALVVSGMLILFASMQAMLLLKGERPTCGCFGLLMQERVGLRTIARDAALATLATMLAIQQ